MTDRPGAIKAFNPTALEWYLEIEGKKVGPYSAEQIIGLLREGEIPINQLVLNDQIQTGWMNVLDLQNHLTHNFKPPERPTDLLSSIKMDPLRENDAANNLFDALIMSKEKRQKQQASEREQLIPLDDVPGTLRRPLFTSNQFVLYGFIIVLLFVSFWGFLSLWNSPKPSAVDTANPIQNIPGTGTAPAAPTKDREIERERERLRSKEKELEKEREKERERIRQQQREMDRERERRQEEDRNRDKERDKPADDFRDPEHLKRTDEGHVPPSGDLPIEPMPQEPPPALPPIEN